jgi:nucleoid-associated protein YgaU
VDDTSFGRQNPTSGAIAGKIHLVREGDRMDLLANQYYKKPMLWRYIAEHNDIDNPRNLTPGTRLIIPPLP